MKGMDITDLVREFWDEVLPGKGIRKHFMWLVQEHTRHVVMQCMYWFIQGKAAPWTIVKAR